MPARAFYQQPTSFPSPTPAAVQPNPYVDYSRALTPQGGIIFKYKDLDKRLRHTLWRLLAWTSFTGMEGWFLFHRPPLHAPWLIWSCITAMSVINWRIVAKPVETYRTVEIRTDCMILEGTDIFWARMMEGLPTFRKKKADQLCCGTYGTRFVEYFTIRSFDDLDRAQTVFMGHLKNAMQQLWMGPQ
jgi:hypothetical protein